jgi:hypothetical protein
MAAQVAGQGDKRVQSLIRVYKKKRPLARDYTFAKPTIYTYTVFGIEGQMALIVIEKNPQSIYILGFKQSA